MNIKDIIESNEREFKEKFTYGVLYSASSDLSVGKGTHFKSENAEEAIKWLHQSQLRLLEGVRAEIEKFGDIWQLEKTAEETKSGCPRFTRINRDLLSSLDLPESNDKEI